jgi:hypothetical protein
MPAKDHTGRARKATTKSMAWRLLAVFARHEGPAVVVRASDGVHEATVTISPRGSAVGSDQAGRCLQFSDAEAAIVHAIGPEGCLPGKLVAKRLGQDYSSKLKILLANLIARQALERTAEGYRWHPRFSGQEKA